MLTGIVKRDPKDITVLVSAMARKKPASSGRLKEPRM